MQIIPSILVQSKEEFITQIHAIEKTVSQIQLDIADGKFVPNTTWADPAVIKKEAKIEKVEFQQSFNRNLFFLEYNKKEVLKTEFTFFPFPRLEQGPAKFGLSVDSLLDIAVNKLFTIYQRSQARDYIDLYCICKERRLRLDDLIKKAKLKFDWHIDPLQLGTQFTKAGEAKDFPRLIKKINHKDWQKFFVNEAKKLRNQILE